MLTDNGLSEDGICTSSTLANGTTKTKHFDFEAEGTWNYLFKQKTTYHTSLVFLRGAVLIQKMKHTSEAGGSGLHSWLPFGSAPKATAASSCPVLIGTLHRWVGGYVSVDANRLIESSTNPMARPLRKLGYGGLNPFSGVYSEPALSACDFILVWLVVISVCWSHVRISFKNRSQNGQRKHQGHWSKLLKIRGFQWHACV